MAAVPPTDRLFRLPRVGQRDVRFTLPRIWFFVFFPGAREATRPNRREGRGRPVWGKRPRARRSWFGNFAKKRERLPIWRRPAGSHRGTGGLAGRACRCVALDSGARRAARSAIHRDSDVKWLHEDQRKSMVAKRFRRSRNCVRRWYVDNISFSLDAKTFWLTILNVLSRVDITPPGMKSMPAFRGRSDDK
jgi:hypothetical protein